MVDLCACGCGQDPGTYASRAAHLNGRAKEFVHGHNRRAPAEDRFEQYVLRGEGCHVWVGATNQFGYGVFGRANGSTTTAHRFAYEQDHGSLGPELVVDHLCNRRNCVNVAHLEAVTQSENVLRAYARSDS